MAETACQAYDRGLRDGRQKLYDDLIINLHKRYEFVYGYGLSECEIIEVLDNVI